MTYWVQFMEDRRWMPGTVLMIPSDVPPFVHFVMVEFVDFHTGVEWAIHNMPGIGVVCGRGHVRHFRPGTSLTLFPLVL
jgi:hypothetical protein